jgi:hypothetical protein
MKNFILTRSQDRCPVIAEIDTAKYKQDRGDLLFQYDEEQLQKDLTKNNLQFDNISGLVYYSAAPSSKNATCFRLFEDFGQIKKILLKIVSN